MRAGAVRSGYHHWLDEGRATGRPLAVETAQLDAPIELWDLRSTITASVPNRVPKDQRIELSVTIANTGQANYSTTGRYPVHFCYRWYDASGAPAEVGHSLHTALPDVVLAGETIALAPQIATPRSPGLYTLALTLLQHDVAWFDDVDAANGLRASVLVESSVPAPRPLVMAQYRAPAPPPLGDVCGSEVVLLEHEPWRDDVLVEAERRGIDPECQPD